MPISILHDSQELINLIQEWRNLPIDHIQNYGELKNPDNTNQTDLQLSNREIVKHLFQLSNLIADITSKISADSYHLTKEELNQISNLTADQLETTSYSNEAK